jgi:hypothetical protein
MQKNKKMCQFVRTARVFLVAVLFISPTIITESFESGTSNNIFLNISDSSGRTKRNSLFSNNGNQNLEGELNSLFTDYTL